MPEKETGEEDSGGICLREGTKKSDDKGEKSEEEK